MGTIHIEVNTKQLKQLQHATNKHRRIILIIDADAVAVGSGHSEAWLTARKLATATWATDLQDRQ